MALNLLDCEVKMVTEEVELLSSPETLDSKVKMETGEVEISYANVVKSRLVQVFQKMTSKITPEVFNEIFEQLGDAGTVILNVDENVQKFKTSLHQSICENFKDMWTTQEIELELNLLEFLKRKCEINTTAWRPTGKTPEEQTKYLRVHYLKKKIAFVNTAIQAQEVMLHETMQEVADKRHEIGNLMSRRETTSQQMDVRMAQISKSDVAVSQCFQKGFRG